MSFVFERQKSTTNRLPEIYKVKLAFIGNSNTDKWKRPFHSVVNLILPIRKKNRNYFKN